MTVADDKLAGPLARVSVDDLAQIIRTVDGENKLGAGALAEAILRALPASGGDAAEVRAHALEQLRWHDERTQRVHDIVEELREIVLAMPAAERPDGLMKKAQDAVYGMRGRVRLLDDAAITAALSPQQGEVEPVAWMKPSHPAVVEPRFILASEMVHDWQRSVFTVPLYATPQHGSEP